ncbi:MAG: alpha/beta hydrolase [Deltaproteobacteria bacterium HGW-Deltaproteobacteria-12]|jgi:pimeloyl-ACP methyl ester carboxylesterase|nr:MAG: alpha/beta hydrolase [Deltaproteobacteria bacterium HGW-Deltaproteobacteria-12]
MTITPGPQQCNAQETGGRRQIMRALTAIILAAFLSGCMLAARAPMDVLTYKNPDNETANECLIVFLRGMGGSHRSFEQEGLVADVWARGLPFDMVAPNAHVGYYGDRNLIERLKEDVIDPARARGYKKIWLVGISMGGLGALLYLMERPQDITGVYLIAPFLGSQSILAEIEEAGGVRQWNPGHYVAADNWQRMLWHWMKTTLADSPDKIVYLGYGTGDLYQRGPQLLAALLPPGRVYVIDGGHDHPTFKALWKIFLTNDAKLRN